MDRQPRLRRRLEIAGHLPSPSRPSVRHFNCLVCGCNLGSDPHADRALGACGTCKSRPEARSLKAAPGVAGSRGFTEAEKSLIRKTHGYIPIEQLLGILNERLKSDLGPNATPHTAEQLHAEITDGLALAFGLDDPSICAKFDPGNLDLGAWRP
jgi:hypothetical protein